jgi:Spy/CpxP family protein refolding chaperone
MDKRKLMALAGGIFAAGLVAAQPGASGSRPVPGPGPGGGPGYHGMMGGGTGMMGAGGGMMGLGMWRNIPDLTQDQRTKIDAIRRDLRNRQFAIMDQMHDQWQGATAYRNGQFDEQASRRAYDATEKLRRQMFENALDAQKRVDALLTAAQRQQLSRAAGQQ